MRLNIIIGKTPERFVSASERFIRRCAEAGASGVHPGHGASSYATYTSYMSYEYGGVYQRQFHYLTFAPRSRFLLVLVLWAAFRLFVYSWSWRVVNVEGKPSPENGALLVWRKYPEIRKFDDGYYCVICRLVMVPTTYKGDTRFRV